MFDSPWFGILKAVAAGISMGVAIGYGVTMATHVIQKDGIKKKVVRCGSVIRLRKGTEARYMELHQNVWPSVLSRIHSSNIRNYTIYHFDSLGLLFSHFEYIGDNIDADMRKIAEDDVTIQWWKECEPCQEPLSWSGPPPSEGGKGDWWLPGKEVFHCGLPPTGYLEVELPAKRE